MKQVSKRLAVANAFGAIGYLSIVFQWIWTLLLLLYPLLMSDPGLLSPQQSVEPSAPIATPSEFSPFVSFIAIVVVILLLIGTVVVMIRLPKTIGRKAKNFTHSTAAVVVPRLMAHKPIGKKERQRLSYMVILCIKLIAIFIPLVALIFVAPEGVLSKQAIWLIGAFSAGCSLFYFIVQQIIAYTTRIQRSKLW